MIHKKVKENITAIVLCIIVSLAGVIFIYRLWDFDFEVPLFYLDGDHLFTLTTLKRSGSFSEFFRSSNLGAPFSGTNFDFPFMGDLGNIVYFKLFTCLFGHSMGLNIGYFMLFPITALISFVVMKKLGIAGIWAIAGSVTFSFLPYRMLRNTLHLFLNCYYQIPIAVIFCFWLIQDDRFLAADKSFFSYKRNLIGVLGFIVIAYTGIYYAFFTAFFVCISIVYKMWNKKDVSCIKNGMAACLLICIPIATGYIPNFLFQIKNGHNIEAPVRNPVEAEVYGMKITQLFIPVRDYGSNWIKSIKEAYEQAPVPNEGSEYLGLAGIAGFVLLIFCLFMNQHKNHKTDEKIMILSKLNIFAVLLGTVGGFGSIFALCISSQIRAYNRISVFIAYFSILSICMVLTNLLKGNRNVSFIVGLIFLFGFFDQMHTESYSFRQEMVNSYYSDKKFVQEIEQLVSENAMIYQWVYQPYPEHPPIQNMGDYASFRGYLHSDHLKWSYGDYKGRDADLWNRNLASKTTEERIRVISNVGFEGIYIDTYAYSEKELAKLLGTMQSVLMTNPLVSTDQRLVFFHLSDYTRQYKEKFSEIEWNQMKNENLTNIQFLNGFYALETDQEYSWRWGAQKGVIRVIKNKNTDSKGTLQMKVFSATEEKVKFTVDSNKEKKEYYIDNQGEYISIPIDETITNICIDTEGERVDAPDDARELYMRIEYVSIGYE